MFKLIADSKITSGFGTRIDPLNIKHEQFHTGVDLVSKDGLVYNTIKGNVRRARFGEFGEGNYIQVKTVIQYITFYLNYFHNEKNLVYEGNEVETNQIIARQGKTGNSTGEHIHHEIFTMNYQIQNIGDNNFKDDLLLNVEHETIGPRMFFNPLDFYNFIKE